jgi:hypothetical protein
MSAYLKILGPEVIYGRVLDKADLCFIGEFTRENISAWLDRGPFLEASLYGHEDFHAVCGDIDIPWAKEDSENAANPLRPWEIVKDRR